MIWNGCLRYRRPGCDHQFLGRTAERLVTCVPNERPHISRLFTLISTSRRYKWTDPTGWGYNQLVARNLSGHLTRGSKIERNKDKLLSSLFFTQCKTGLIFFTEPSKCRIDTTPKCCDTSNILPLVLTTKTLLIYELLLQATSLCCLILP